MKTGSPIETVAARAAATRRRASGSSAGFDAEKVRALRQAIASGRFAIDADAIAGRLLAEIPALRCRFPH